MANVITARRSGLVLRGGRQRRETIWGGTAAFRGVIGGAQTAILAASLNAAALALRPFTIVRVRGFWHVRSDQVIATEQYGCSQGWAIVSDQASAIGVTAVPTPDTDIASDLWFLFESLYGTFMLLDSTGTQQQGMGATFDSKAMRKVQEGEDVVQMFESGTALTSSSATITVVSRFLIKLH